MALGGGSGMLILLASLLVFLLLGVPIAYSLGLSGFAYFAMVHPELLSILPARLYAGMNSYAMIAMPLFVFMGVMLERSGIAERLYDALYLWLGGLRGGLAVVTVLMGTIIAIKLVLPLLGRL